MSIYLPNFNDQRIIDFCGAFGATVDGFYAKLGDLGYTGSIDDRWKAYLIDRYGYFNGLHINGYEDEGSFAFTTYEPTSWAWFDGRTEVTRTTAMTGQPTEASNVFFAGWFSPEGVGVNSPTSGILGMLIAYLAQTPLEGNLININRVAANLPVNRFALKDGFSSLFTNSVEYFNASSPVNSNKYFLAAFIDEVTTVATLAIFNGTSWEVVTADPFGLGSTFDANQVYPTRIGGHNASVDTRWWGRLANVGLAYDIDPIDLTSSSVRNSLLVDPGSDGSGYGVGPMAAFFSGDAATMNAGTNAGTGGTFDSITDGLVANYPYTQRRAVNAAGAAHLNLPTVTGITTGLPTFFFSCWFKVASSVTALSPFMYMHTGTGTFGLGKQASGNGNGAGIIVSDGVIGPTPGPGATRSEAVVNDGVLHHFVCVGSIAGDYIVGYVDGEYSFGTTSASWGMTNFGTLSGIRVGANTGSTIRLVGEIGDLWFSETLPADLTAAIATLYNGGTPPLLTERNHKIQGVSPIVLVGQGMGLDHWNAGKNLGTGGTFTPSSAFT